MRKYKTIMELIFIFLLPLILILSGLNLKENQITTNTGYEWNTYIEYNNKILKDTNGYKNVIENFNIWDEKWELGSYYTVNGEKAPSTIEIRNKNDIPCQPNTTYYYDFPSGTRMWVFFYDANGNYLGDVENTNWVRLLTKGTFTSPTGAYIMKFTMYSNYGTTYKNDICINKSISWANGNYAPYGKPLIIYSQTDISGQNNIVYTPFGTIKNLIIDNFEIQQNTITDILFDYTILWFLMFILWHVLYLFFDMLIHLFIDWGHKEKEKINE